MDQKFGKAEKSAKINAFAVSRTAHRYQGVAFFDEELDLLDRAIRIKLNRVYAYGESGQMKGKPKAECGKIRYRSRKDALLALQRVRAHRARQMEFGEQFVKMESRVYRCSVCAHGYHLTSKPFSNPRHPAPVAYLPIPVASIPEMGVIAHVA